MTREEAIKQLKDNRVLCINSETEPFAIAYDLAIKALEQEPILDKIRTEIKQEYTRLSATRADETLELGECLGLKMSLKILDKYKAESEDKESEDNK